MFFSIVIPLYNKAQSVLHTLRCVEAQTYTNYEVVIVNDGSTDDSANIVSEWLDQNHAHSDTWRLIDKPNGGVSSARNRGVREAQYDYIAFLDADDYWEPAYLATHAQLIQDFPEAAMWGVGWGNLQGKRKKSIPHFRDSFRGYVKNYWTEKKKTLIFWTSAIVIYRPALETVGLYDERLCYGEDNDVMYRMILNYPVAFDPTIVAYYRQDAENRACLVENIPLELRLEFYMDKYAEQRRTNKDFCRFFDIRVALVLRGHLFCQKDKRVYRLTEQLDYSFLPLRYRLYYQTPFWIGKTVYCIEKWAYRLYNTLFVEKKNVC